MLHFARSRDWKSMNSIPASVWRLAESDRVTIHPALSMHEHFRKQLQRKTLIEQRIIMAKAAADSEEEEEQEVQVVELPSRDRASPSSTGFRDAATPESTTPTQSRVSQRTPSSAGRQSAITPASTIESRLKEGEEEKFSSATRRKKTAPLRETPTQLTPATSTTPSTPASRSTPAPSASSMTPWTPGDLSSGQKRKRNTPSSGATVSQNSNASSQETGESDVESVGSKRDGGGEFGVYFRCAWAEIAQDLTKRRMLQRFFESTPAPAQHQGSSTDSVLGGASTVVFEEGDNSENSSEPLQTSAVQMEYATDEGMDDIICQLLVDTLSDMPSVAHALYYCSGDVEMARAFLKGASAPDMWSPGDDLLLANLVAEGNIDRSEVDAAVARGDFDSMQRIVARANARVEISAMVVIAWDALVASAAMSSVGVSAARPQSRHFATTGCDEKSSELALMLGAALTTPTAAIATVTWASSVCPLDCDGCVAWCLGCPGSKREICTATQALKLTLVRRVSAISRHSAQWSGILHDRAKRLELIDAIVSEISPASLPRVITGIGHPLDVLDTVNRGIDAFVSPYPATVTKAGSALIFWISDDEDGGSASERNVERKRSGGVLHLREKRFATDFGPLMAGCDCFACQNSKTGPRSVSDQTTAPYRDAATSAPSDAVKQGAVSELWCLGIVSLRRRLAVTQTLKVGRTNRPQHRAPVKVTSTTRHFLEKIDRRSWTNWRVNYNHNAPTKVEETPADRYKYSPVAAAPDSLPAEVNSNLPRAGGEAVADVYVPWEEYASHKQDANDKNGSPLSSEKTSSQYGEQRSARYNEKASSPTSGQTSTVPYPGSEEAKYEGDRHENPDKNSAVYDGALGPITPQLVEEHTAENPTQIQGYGHFLGNVVPWNEASSLFARDLQAEPSDQQTGEIRVEKSVEESREHAAVKEEEDGVMTTMTIRDENVRWNQTTAIPVIPTKPPEKKPKKTSFFIVRKLLELWGELRVHDGVTTPSPTQIPTDKTCIDVSVEGDATYCIRGPICSGSGSTPSGSLCPVKGDVTVKDCSNNTLPSWTSAATCVAPVDATCSRIKTGAWGCVYGEVSNATTNNPGETETRTQTSTETPSKTPTGTPTINSYEPTLYPTKPETTTPGPTEPTPAPSEPNEPGESTLGPPKPSETDKPTPPPSQPSEATPSPTNSYDEPIPTPAASTTEGGASTSYPTGSTASSSTTTKSATSNTTSGTSSSTKPTGTPATRTSTSSGNNAHANTGTSGADANVAGASTSTGTTSNGASGVLSGGAIAGIIIACIAFVAIIVGAVLVRQRSIDRQREENLFAELSGTGGRSLETDYAAM
ncbi:tRNA-guanine(15) transglycosylase-like [Phytophthora cactorum]|nr:tRNA-guanine(15) transglycosylase-like [Phytophthora cactorum]